MVVAQILGLSVICSIGEWCVLVKAGVSLAPLSPKQGLNQNVRVKT